MPRCEVYDVSLVILKNSYPTVILFFFFFFAKTLFFFNLNGDFISIAFQIWICLNNTRQWHYCYKESTQWRPDPWNQVNSGSDYWSFPLMVKLESLDKQRDPKILDRHWRWRVEPRALMKAWNTRNTSSWLHRETQEALEIIEILISSSFKKKRELDELFPKKVLFITKRHSFS